ncbi:FHA domain-containing protein [Cohnella xylanilytica]|uniref:FHA domain-containing protein n=1 Tax=Cohnella xylanilytica TaxID=557555 RepID=UPI001BB3604F|nr:FHA domain-containing protein [Cohnella xylanilytica]
MLTVVDRIGRSGPRALVTSGRAFGRAREHPQRETAPGTRIRRKIARLSAAGTACWLGFGATSAEAADRAAMPAAQGVGTLPLLAAMGIGIAAAAVAVIAFLQMTARAKNIPEDDGDVLEEKADADNELGGADTALGAADTDRREPASVLQTAGGERAGDPGDPDAEFAAGLGAQAPDYTRPLPAMPAGPEAALPAEEGSPRLWGVEGEFAGSGFRVTERWLTLGRDSTQCGLAFPYNAGEVSRRHCSLKFEAERGLFLLEDHDSSNGTFLSGGERLEPGIVYELRPGSRFSLSGTRHWFEVQV